MAEKYYLGNPLLKKTNTNVDLTEEQILELGRCAINPAYFAKKYVKIVTLDKGLQPFEMYDFQERMLQSFHNNRFNVALLPRQMGKCLHLNTIVKLRNKKTGLIQEVKIGDFYEQNRQKSQDFDLP